MLANSDVSMTKLPSASAKSSCVLLKLAGVLAAESCT